MYSHNILAVGTAVFHILTIIATEGDQAEWPKPKKNNNIVNKKNDMGVIEMFGEMCEELTRRVRG